MADVSPVLNANSFIEVRPVTLDVDSNPVSYGVPILVKLSDLATYFSSAGTVPAATTSEVGGVLQAEAQANFAGADVAALEVELNAFLAKLVAAGIVASA